MIYAIYRALYGETWIQQSINSIIDYVDAVFVFYDDVPWGNVQRCIYKGEVVVFPEQFDDILEKIKELNNSKINLIKDHVFDNRNQFTHLINDVLLKSDYDRPNIIMVIEVDHVFRKDQLEQSIAEFKDCGCANADTGQIELWRYLNYRIPERADRAGVVFWNMDMVEKLPQTRRQAEAPGMDRLSTYVHNLGFAFSEKVMFWKHLTALGFSQAIGDSIPNEDWYENKWLNWDYETNNKDLEISIGYEHLIPCAEKYDTSELPEAVKLHNFQNRSEHWAKELEGESNNFLLSHTKSFENKSILEIGPGPGQQYMEIMEKCGDGFIKKYSIADICDDRFGWECYKDIPEENKHVLRTYNIHLGEQFDIIHCWYVIHHVLKTEIDSFVDFVYRHLKGGGFFLFNYPTTRGSGCRFSDKNDGMKTTKFERHEILRAFHGKFDFKSIDEQDCNVNVLAKKIGGN